VETPGFFVEMCGKTTNEIKTGAVVPLHTNVALPQTGVVLQFSEITSALVVEKTISPSDIERHPNFPNVKLRFLPQLH
jgi:hypothetical protein